MISIFRRSRRGIDNEQPGKKSLKIWSCAGTNFTSEFPATNDKEHDFFAIGKLKITTCPYIMAPVMLPQSAEIIRIRVIGNAAASSRSWSLRRIAFADSATTQVSTANINSYWSFVKNEIVDNEKQGYSLFCATMASGDEIWGAIIEYLI